MVNFNTVCEYNDFNNHETLHPLVSTKTRRPDYAASFSLLSSKRSFQACHLALTIYYFLIELALIFKFLLVIFALII
jgi:hypothetical protein